MILVKIFRNIKPRGEEKNIKFIFIKYLIGYNGVTLFTLVTESIVSDIHRMKSLPI